MKIKEAEIEFGDNSSIMTAVGCYFGQSIEDLLLNNETFFICRDGKEYEITLMVKEKMKTPSAAKEKE